MGEDLKRVTYNLSVRQFEALKAIQEDEGVPMATTIRRAVDAYLASRVPRALPPGALALEFTPGA